MERTMLPYNEYKEIVGKMPILTVDAIVVHQGKYLLLKRKLEPLKGKYWLPGGRVLRGELLHEAVVRKMKEELGVNVKVVGLAGFHDYIFKENEFELDYVHTVSAVFYVSPVDTEIQVDFQSDDYIWADNLPKELNLIK